MAYSIAGFCQKPYEVIKNYWQFAGLAVFNSIFYTLMRRSQAGFAPFPLPWQGVLASGVADLSVSITDQRIFTSVRHQVQTMLHSHGYSAEQSKSIATIVASTAVCFLDLFINVPVSNASSTYSANPQTRLQDLHWFSVKSTALILTSNLCFLPVFYGAQHLLEGRTELSKHWDTVLSSVVAVLLANIPYTALDTYRTRIVNGQSTDSPGEMTNAIFHSYLLGGFSFILGGIVRGLDLNRIHDEHVEDVLPTYDDSSESNREFRRTWSDWFSLKINQLRGSQESRTLLDPEVERRVYNISI